MSDMLHLKRCRQTMGEQKPFLLLTKRDLYLRTKYMYKRLKDKCDE